MSTPAGLDWFDLIEYYAFRVVLLISLLWTLFPVLKHKLRDEKLSNVLRYWRDTTRRGGRVVDRARLESGSTFTGTGSSNLPLSARTEPITCS